MKSKYKSYPSYKDSGIEWLGEIPEGWEVKKLKYIANARPSNIDKKSKDGEKNVFLCNYTDVYYNDFITNDIDFMKATATDEQIKKFHLEVGDVIITKDSEGPEDIAIATCVQETEDNLVCGYHLTHIKPTLCDGNYLFRAFNSNGIHDQFKIAANGITRYGIGVYGIDNALFPIPSIQEQQTIANYLDKATVKIDTLIEKQTKLIELLKEKRQAVISTAVTRGLDSTVAMKDSGVAWLGDIPKGWRNYRIDWVSTIIRGNTGFKKDELLDNGEFIALQYGKTYKVNEINEAFNFYVNSEFYKSGQVVHYGDTILISTSETVEDLGHSCFYGRNDLGLIGGEQILLKPNKKLLFEKYLYYYSKVFCKDLRKYSTGLKVFRFSIDDLKNIFIAIPSLEEQEKIANHIDQKTQTIDTLITKATKAIDLLKERRTALISAVVTGKVDVRNYDKGDTYDK